MIKTSLISPPLIRIQELVFKETDADLSGEIDLEELKNAMTRMTGKNCSAKKAKHIMEETDKVRDLNEHGVVFMDLSILAI